MSTINMNLKSAIDDKHSELSTETSDFSNVSHQPLTEAITINKIASKAFNVGLSINPLISAAAPILMAITTLKKEAVHNDLPSLHETLLLEIKTFESKARKFEYRSAIILAARYFLCAFIDEALATAQNNRRNPSQKNSLLQTLQGETWGGDRVFMILQRASDDPQSHIDLLEFGFLCLSLGYQGKYQKPENPMREFENIKDNLLLIINRIRGNPPTSLFVTTGSESMPAITYKKKSKKIPHLLLAAGIFVVSILGVYLTYHIHLSYLSKPVANLITSSQVNHDE